MPIYDNRGNGICDNSGNDVVLQSSPIMRRIPTLDDRVRDNFSRALMNILRVRYTNQPNIQYSVAGGAYVPLFASVADATITSVDELEADTDQEVRPFEIPLQYDASGKQLFPRTDGAGRPYILSADKILWSGIAYAVQSYVVQAQGGLFIINAMAIRPTILGVPSR